MRTSLTHPLQIATLCPGTGMGRIGITFCPGKVQAGAMTGSWNRDLGLDLDAVRDWGAVVVVTLIEDHELETLQIQGMGDAVRKRHMDWMHLPIPDVSVPGPSFERAWTDCGPDLLGRLRCGFDVLVHCKGGLGRAGTIVARLMVELGHAPQAAIDAVRAARPGAIETVEQERYVRTLTPLPEATPATTEAAIRDRAVGALLGLAVGDAIGTTLEFRSRDSYAPLTDMVGGGPFGLKPGEWTDDTAMALALADSLVEAPVLDERDLMQRFVDWHEKGTYSCTGHCFDIGMTTRQALARWKRSGDPMAGSTDPMSAGNGSLMRLAPAAIRHWRDRARLRDVAARQSRTTHAAPEAVDACVTWAELLADAIEGQPRSAVLRNRPGGYTGVIDGIMAGSWRSKPRHAIRATGYVAHSLEASLWSIGASGDFASAVLRAANLGEDADTTAAIAGQLAGALYGAAAIPVQWWQRLAWADRIEVKAERLCEAF
ncbi:ADP-ribosylglycohydrolase family protein [Ruegeria sp. WL0004]|uniref:ADP-ribosylglycohydrolase family protein n=1 Tax=Ruegeria marisflavi TaxID=2984152 RepID=A0ABT2WRD1_9RHOB|nr:ADP-ribosylglycohydrolase family protein [Ruegeria sp. WL0004]MCU9838464.1 ADP-ribosylglycohydrolase family protein [Ruegeria sp. WL0004]